MRVNEKFMRIIKLDATDSTNAYLKRLVSQENVENRTVVLAEEQTSGRGQMGAKWSSEPYKNLTFTVLYKGIVMPANDAFILNMTTSLAVSEALAVWQVPCVSVKWPNDIMTANLKICGILIENVLVGNAVRHSLIGVGINVNQTVFEGLPNATSVALALGNEVDRDAFLGTVLDSLDAWLTSFPKQTYEALQGRYERLLFRRDVPSDFRLASGKFLQGTIKGVGDQGRLRVLVPGRERESLFNFKELELLY